MHAGAEPLVADVVGAIAGGVSFQALVCTPCVRDFSGQKGNRRLGYRRNRLFLFW